jgi:signal transduction histidine kinase
MRERAEMIQGSFDIRGEPGKGTTITVRVPLTEPQLADKNGGA